MEPLSESAKANLLATVSYYCRSVSWIAILFFILFGIGKVENDTIQSLKAVVCYAILLVILLVMKIYRPVAFDNFKWYCTPGNTFLRSWITIMFYVFLVVVPLDLRKIQPAEIISWGFQCSFGNFFAVAIVGAITSFTLYLVRLWNGTTVEEKDYDPNEELKTPEPDRESEASYDGRASKVVNLNQPNTEMFTAMQDLEVGFGNENRSSNLGRSSVVRIGSMARASLTISRISTIKAEVRDSMVEGGPTMINTETLPSVQNVNDIPTIRPMLSRISESGESVVSSEVSRSISLESDFATPPFMEHFEVDNGSTNPTSSDGAKKIESIPKQESKGVIVGVPFIPTMPQLCEYWTYITIFFAFLNFFFPHKSRNVVIGFQMSITFVVFLWSTVYRNFLIGQFHFVIQLILQAVVIFTPVMIFIVIFTSVEGWVNWPYGLVAYHTGKTVHFISKWGAGDFVSIFLDPAIVSLAFASVDAFIEYATLLPILVPAIAASCIGITIQAAVLSHILNSPSVIALALLTRTVTTPVAINLTTLTGASPAIVAASTVINGIVNYRTVPQVLTLLRVTNPLSRGISAAVSGTLMGVVAMDENGEPIAAGIGMAGFGIATILYALFMAVSGYQSFLTGFA